MSAEPFDRLRRWLAGQLRALSDRIPVRYVATINAVASDAATVDVAYPAVDGDVVVEGVPYLAGYSPTVGDEVLVNVVQGVAIVHGRVQSAAAPDRVVLRTGDFIALEGAPQATDNYSTMYLPGWRFDQTEDEWIGLMTMLPESWQTFRVKLYWFSNVASGNVRWITSFLTPLPVDEGDSVATTGVSLAATDAVAGTNLLTITDLGSTASTTAGALINVSVGRDANNGADTLAGDAILLLVVLERAT